MLKYTADSRDSFGGSTPLPTTEAGTSSDGGPDSAIQISSAIFDFPLALLTPLLSYLVKGIIFRPHAT
jgi:hypothetical protein